MGSRKVNLIKGKNFSAVSDIFERGHHDWWVYGSAVGDESGQHLLFMKTKKYSLLRFYIAQENGLIFCFPWRISFPKIIFFVIKNNIMAVRALT